MWWDVAVANGTQKLPPPRTCRTQPRQYKSPIRVGTVTYLRRYLAILAACRRNGLSLVSSESESLNAGWSELVGASCSAAFVPVIAISISSPNETG